MIKQRIIRMILAFAYIVGIFSITQIPVRAQENPPTTPIEHVIVVMQQNHTFDNYFGTFPGADGHPPGVCMPINPENPDNTSCIPPYYIGDQPIENLDHSTTTFELQYNNGAMDGFVYGLEQRFQDGSIAMGYYDDRDLPFYWNLAEEYVLFDHFFSSAKGGSIWNRMFWVAGVPGNENNRIPEGGFQNIPTIFDRLEEKGISWKFYVNNYDPEQTYRSLDGSTLLNPQVQWVPLLSFDRFIDDPELSSHIVDLDEYYADLQNGTLPAVSYVLALGATEHPLTSLQVGQQFMKNMIQGLMRSEMWESSAFMITYDDWGGWYDHVPPPQVDEYGYGFRVPAMLVSPYAKQGFVDSTLLDFTSILKFIEGNWGIDPLSSRDANANNLTNAFDFTASPRTPRFISFERSADEKLEPRRNVIYLAYGSALILAVVVITAALIIKHPDNLAGELVESDYGENNLEKDTPA